MRQVLQMRKLMLRKVAQYLTVWHIKIQYSNKSLNSRAWSQSPFNAAETKSKQPYTPRWFP
jgi:hypothetical protein